MTVFGVTLANLSAVSSIALTAMSTVVAGVALLFSFRQNAGWKPIALVVGQTMRGSGPTAFEFGIQIEVWNRRRYPIILRSVAVDVSGFTLQKGDASENAYTRDNRHYQKIDESITPGEHHVLMLPFSFEMESLDAMQPAFAIALHYFDPLAGRERTLHLNHKHFYPELGWKLTTAERDEARERYRQLHQTPP